jgi:hypothetical protein
MISSRHFIQRGLARMAQITGIPLRYVDKFELSGEWKGLQLVHRIWISGLPGRLGLFMLVIGAAASALQIETSIAQPPGADVELTLPVMLIGIVLFAAGCAYAAAASSALPVWGYLIVVAYLSFNILHIGGSMAGSPLFAIPTLWFLIIGLRITDRTKPGWRLWLSLLCYCAAYLTFGAFGLQRVFTGDMQIIAPFILGLIYFLLLANRHSLRLVRNSSRPPAPGHVFWSTLVVICSFFALAIAIDETATAQRTLLSMRSLLGILDLFWMWLGAGLFLGAIALGRWITTESMTILPPRAARSCLLFSWIAVAVFCWIATHDIPMQAAVIADDMGLFSWVNTWSLPVFEGAYYQVFASMAAVLLFIIILARHALLRRTIDGQLTGRSLAWLNGLWLAAFISVVRYFQALTPFGSLYAKAAEPLAFWSALTLVGGLIWTMAKQNDEWSRVSEHRALALIAWLLLMLSVCVVILGAGLPELILEFTLYSFLGALYLGLPLAAYTIICEQSDRKPVSVMHMLALFGAGVLSASLALGIDPMTGPHLLIGPVVWIAALLLWRRMGKITSAAEGAVAGAVTSLGFVTFWMSPQYLHAPFISLWSQWQERYLQIPREALHRPLLQEGQIWFTLVALTVGMLIGIICAYRAGRRAAANKPD